jgi:hypothetical protein
MVRGELVYYREVDGSIWSAQSNYDPETGITNTEKVLVEQALVEQEPVVQTPAEHTPAEQGPVDDFTN